MFEMGHSFEEIDRMSMEDMGDAIAYWHENSRIEERRARKNKNLRGK